MDTPGPSTDTAPPGRDQTCSMPGMALAPLEFSSGDHQRRRLTHYLFRFPAKFHPPVVAHLLRDYTSVGETVLDPFCGSGTLMVEAAVAGRHSIGLDVDPLAIFMSRVKSRALAEQPLERALERLLARFVAVRRSASEYEERQWEDLTAEEWQRESEGLPIPAIPNLDHWFRRYVSVDLARLLAAIDSELRDRRMRAFFRLVFASCIRNASNADPVPVSGLEVTKHMRRLDDQGRVIDPFAMFERRARRAVTDMAEFAELRDPSARVGCRRVDVTTGLARVGSFNAVITSPPYHGAVDYYRRHQLEHFWIGLVADQVDRLKLLDGYLGRPKVPARHRFVARETPLPEWALEWERTIATADPERARAFRHYCVGMSRSLSRLALALKPGGRAIFVVGHSRWKDAVIDTSQLFSELSRGALRLVERRFYPVSNRYMSYERHNGASIDAEYVLVYESVLSSRNGPGRRGVTSPATKAATRLRSSGSSTRK